MPLKQKVTNFILHLFTPSKGLFLIISGANALGYWYYEQFLWLKLFLIAIIVVMLFWFYYLDAIQPIATMNVFLVLRNLYFIVFAESIQFNTILVIGFLLFLIIFYLVINFEKNIKVISENKNTLLYTMFGALSISQFQFLLLYWRNVPEATMAILITLVYYIYIRTIEIEEDFNFRGRQILQIFAIVVIICIFILTSLSWKDY